MTVSSFHPPSRVLMGPGPSDIHSRVLQALGRPVIGHLDPEFIMMMDEIKGLLHYAFQTTNQMTLPISAPGSAGMECAFVNLVEPGDNVIVCVNGVFGGRMVENVERCGATAIKVVDDWGTPIDLNKLEDALKANPGVKAVAFVHAETSTGVQSDAAAISALAQKFDALTIMDAVTSLAGTPVLVDEWKIDACYSGTQKCLSCVPGLSPVTFSERALETIRGRNHKVQSWFLDLNLIMGYWSSEGATRSYHHTAPVNTLYALHESLVMLKEEGLENAWKRHAKNHLALKAGLEALGLTLLVEEGYRLPQLNAVKIPGGVDEALVRRRMLADFGIEIGAGLGALAGKVWRIGLMGQSSSPRHVTLVLSALEGTLTDMGANTGNGGAAQAAQKVLLA
ncbi:pyridoxal-phosphate-dependent aminotransferase family protein [Magnetovibrio blakemorei]|uniref:Alanine--glyoxylate aminotransferase n=1 Tax=Magnetovibrio blakemorei TaxID=28181 RepID=A0A1E5QBM3_9PROT|nr:alanine--glyoxylate aminotransferase family protein [Magnetovibrio blakemorei]OEJ69427.1 alanine--glyoxylate aminotransferase [Magnetovibrio blakemorei]